MTDDKLELVQKFLKFVKEHDVRKEGKITSNKIEQEMKYSSRHLSRIFRPFVNSTPIRISEMIRLNDCVEYIHDGHTLKEAALQFDFTPEGLSNAIKNKLGLNVEKIIKGDYVLKKRINITNSWNRLGNYKYEFEKEIFIDYIEALNNMKILREMTSNSSTSDNIKQFDLHFDYKMISNLLDTYNNHKVGKALYEDLSLEESVIMYAMLTINGIDKGEVTFSIEELVSTFFLISFFFDVNDLKFKDGYFTFTIGNKISALFESLHEIEQVTKEKFDIMLQATFKDPHVTVEFHPVLKAALEF